MSRKTRTERRAKAAEGPQSILEFLGRHRFTMASGLVIALAIALRLHHLDKQSLWWDEGLSIAASRPNFARIIETVVHSDFHPPEYYFMLHAWMAAFGSSPFDVRLLSALIGVAGVAMTYVIARDMFNARIGVMAGLLVAMSQFHIYYSQEARSYGLLFVTSVAATHAYWLQFHSAGRSRGKLAYYLASTTFLLYSHFAGIFVVAAHGIHRLVLFTRHPDRKLMRSWLGTQAALATMYLPWAFALVQQTRRLQDGFWMPVPAFDISPRLPLDFSVIGTLIQFTGRGVRVGLVCFLIVNAFVAARLPGINEPRRGTTDSTSTASYASRLGLLAAWFSCSILLPYLQSLISQPIYVSRLAIPALAPLCLLAAVGISTLRFRAFRLAVMAILVALAIPGLQAYYSTDFKERWDLAANAVEGVAAPGDIVILAPGTGGLESWLAYAKRADLEILFSDSVSGSSQMNTSSDVWLVTRQGARCEKNPQDPLVLALGENRTLVSCLRISPSGLPDFHMANNPLYVRHFRGTEH